MFSSLRCTDMHTDDHKNMPVTITAASMVVFDCFDTTGNVENRQYFLNLVFMYLPLLLAWD